MIKEKLTCSIQQTKISESTKTTIRKICNEKDRKEQEIVRFALNAMAQRWENGKKKDEELY